MKQQFVILRDQLDVAEMSKRELADIARDPRVRAIAPSMPVQLIAPVDTNAAPDERPEPGPTWGVRAVAADTATHTGEGVTVAVLDTGIDATHPAFSGVELVQRDFSGSGDGDNHGHGTHCAGTIFGRDVDGVRIGVAPGVTRAVIGKVLGDSGKGDTALVSRAMLWAVEQGAQVISMSLGWDFSQHITNLIAQGFPVPMATSMGLEAYRANLRLFDATMAMVQAQPGGGALVIVASGNGSSRGERPDFEVGPALPAAADDVVSVGALQQTPDGLQVASFSNTFPLVSGPGVTVWSAQAGGGLTAHSGTSMATPHVAGVAALWWQQVLASNVPPQRATTLARLVASAVATGFAPGTDPTDHGAGLVKAPA